MQFNAARDRVTDSRSEIIKFTTAEVNQSYARRLTCQVVIDIDQPAQHPATRVR